MRGGWLLTLVVALALLGAPLGAHTLERPGGGQGYGGGSSGGGGDGGGSGGGGDVDGEALGELIAALLRLAVWTTREYPKLMWPFWGVLAVGLVFRHRFDVRLPDWTSGSFRLRDDAAAGGGASLSPPPPARPHTLARAQLEPLREADPDFSLVLFEDFVYALFARAHEARGRGRLAELGAYLAPEAQRALADLSTGLAAVEGIVVGAMRYTRVWGVSPPEDRIVVELEIEANYTELAEAPGHTGPSAYWASERWKLARPRGARSLPPERVRSFGCPACGAPLGTRDSGACAHCGRSIDPSDFDWLVEAVRPQERRRTPPALTGDVPESGTQLDTIVDPEARTGRAEIEADDPAFTWPAFEARVRHVFTELQPAWSSLDLPRARPYLSDNLFQAWMFWIDAYRKAGLRNVSENARVTGLRLARVVRDRHYDAITVRLRATGLDYTVDANGHKLAGSRDELRDYSEYWTLIRGHGVKGTPRTDKSCPRCGGPLAVNMAGSCESCGARVSSGEFDWVLSRVEQDESYQG